MTGMMLYLSLGLMVLTVLFSLLAGFAFWKGRLLLGMLAIFVPFVTGLWAAVRLATPSSPWARSRYDEAKMARARERFGPRILAAKHIAEFGRQPQLIAFVTRGQGGANAAARRGVIDGRQILQRRHRLRRHARIDDRAPCVAQLVVCIQAHDTNHKGHFPKQRARP